MSRKDYEQQPKVDETAPAAETEPKKAEPKTDGPTHFDSTITKVKTDEDGREYTVMSDFLDEGEKLKRDVDAEKAEKKAAAAKKDAK